MYTGEMLESMRKVEAKRAENAVLEPRRMTAEEKENLLAHFHPDYKQEEFELLKVGPNKGQKVPKELAAVLQGNPRINERQIDLNKIDYIIANHGECDHSGALTALMDEIPGKPIYCTANAVKSIEGQYGKRGWNFNVVKFSFLRMTLTIARYSFEPKT